MPGTEEHTHVNFHAQEECLHRYTKINFAISGMGAATLTKVCICGKTVAVRELTCEQLSEIVPLHKRLEIWERLEANDL